MTTPTETPIIVQHGRSGLNSPRYHHAHIIVISAGAYSRTGRTYGNVDEGRGVRVTAYRAGDICAYTGDRNATRTETLFAPERWDDAARNRLGRPGAFVQQEPAQEEIGAAVQRAREHLEQGLPHAAPIRTRVRPEPRAEEHDLCPVAVNL